MSIPKAVQELIDGSGNTFHAKVAQWFTSNGWLISISPYYMDQAQQKARELDLIAEKVIPISNSLGRPKMDIAVRLFVECKYLPAQSVFWFVDKNIASITQMILSTGHFRENNFYTDKHHYLASSKRVAKLFASSNAKGPEGEPFYKALNQSLNGLVSMRSQLPRVLTNGRQVIPQITLDYPVVVCSSFAHVYAADFSGTAPTDLVHDNFQLEVQYAYADQGGQSRDELFLLDIVEFDQLQKLVESVDEDATIVGYFASDE